LATSGAAAQAGRAVLTALRPISDIERPGIRMSFRKTAAVGVALVWAVALGGPAFAQEDRGKVLFGLCTQCHGEDGGGDPVALAPGIAGLGEWYILAQLGKFRSGVRGTHFDDIPGMRMRPMSLTLRSEDDVKAVAAYVASLPPMVRSEPLVEGGDPQRGQKLYATCAACHGAKGEGNEKLFAPALIHTGGSRLEPAQPDRDHDASHGDDAGRRAGPQGRRGLCDEAGRIPLMAKAYSGDDLAMRTFVISMMGVAAFIAIVFIFIL
jgi:cytochrome c553